MNAITTADPTTIVTVDLGKYNSLACRDKPAAGLVTRAMSSGRQTRNSFGASWQLAEQPAIYDRELREGFGLELIGTRQVVTFSRTRFFSRMVIIPASKSTSCRSAQSISDRLAPVWADNRERRSDGSL